MLASTWFFLLDPSFGHSSLNQDKKDENVGPSNEEGRHSPVTTVIHLQTLVL